VTLRLGSIGSGGRGRISKMAHRPEEDIHLVAVCDPKPGTTEEYQRDIDPPPQAYDDYRALLDNADVDAVFITTPDHMHEAMAIEALRRGIGVYLEKPLAITTAGCDRILEAAQKHQARLYVGHNLRFFPIFRKMKQIIDSGRIGEVQAIWCRHFIAYGGDAYYKDWHADRRCTNTLLLQKGSHDIDLIHHLARAHTQRTVGMGMLSVYNRIDDRHPADTPGDPSNTDVWPPLAQTQLNPVLDVEDHNAVLMQLANGVQATYQQCHYTPDSHRNYTVIGTEGRIENCGDYATAEFQPVIRLWTRRVAYVENGTESISVPPMPGGHGGADPEIVSDFLRYLETGQFAGAAPIDARQAVAVGELAARSLREGNRPMDVPPVPRHSSEPEPMAAS